MAKFRKKPVEIEAWPVFDLCRDAGKMWSALPDAVKEAYERGDIVFGANEIFIKTLEGEMVGRFDDLLIQGVKGEFYPCKADIFAATYESVPEPVESSYHICEACNYACSCGSEPCSLCSGCKSKLENGEPIY